VGAVLGGALGGAPFSALWAAVFGAGALQGDRIAGAAVLVGLGCLAAALLGAALGERGRALARFAGVGYVACAVLALFAVAAHVSQSLFGILEPLKLASLAGAVLIWLPPGLGAWLGPPGK
jgi:hypothetical protein